jgi:histidine triad (HIT) family protein
MGADCIFCKIIAGTIPSARLEETDFAIAIRDLHPQARAHFLVIPKLHTTHLDELSQQPNGTEMLGRLLSFAAALARKQGLMPDGYRVVANTNAHGGQSVYHLHFHVLGGQALAGSFGV